MTMTMTPSAVAAVAAEDDDDLLVDHDVDESNHDDENASGDNEDPVASLLGMSDTSTATATAHLVSPPAAPDDAAMCSSSSVTAVVVAAGSGTGTNDTSLPFHKSENDISSSTATENVVGSRSSNPPPPSPQPPPQAAKSPIRTYSTMSNNDDNSNHSIIHHKKTIHQNTIPILKSSVAPPTTIAPPPTSSSSSSQQQQLQLENSTLREKNDKLKSLLGRSAKAQRDAKHELERIKRLYESIKLENETLGMRVEALANRPTHMDLLADFEANFDRALLSVGNSSGGNNNRGQQQSGGEDAAEVRYSSSTTTTTNEGTTTTTPYLEDPSSSSTGGTATTTHLLLLAEQQLDEANSQIANLESIHATYQQRYDALEKSYMILQKERKSLTDTCAILRLELRGAKSDMEKWEREYRMACATVEEMRLEVDLATRAAAEANRRAAYAELGMSVGSSGGGGVGGMTGMPARGSGGVGGGGGGNQPPADNDYVSGLEAKVAALQEWALASAESKRLTAERCMELEERVRELEEQQGKSSSSLDDGEDGRDSTILMSSGLAESVDNKGCSISNVLGSNADASAGGNTSASSQYDGSPSGRERKLWTKSSSLVVGAGMVGHAILELGPISVEPSETVILRWKFDITPADLDIDFSVLKGMCEDARARRGADACLRVRRVMGGGGGDVGGAFARQNACTMVWSNEMSWVRPRTVKWTAEAVAIGWGD